MQSTVVMIKCQSYQYVQVKSAVQQGIDLLGGVNHFAQPGEKILLKPNLLAGEAPERCVTTHPSVFQAVAEVFQPASCELCYGDSPAFQSMEAVAKKTGIADAAQKAGVSPTDFKTVCTVHFENAIQNKKLFLAQGALEADGIISIGKLKTHAFAKMTGAIKNQFGCVPGLLKAEFHAKLPDLDNFAKMLVDLNLYLRPRLFITDGILAMEGNGPRGGVPRAMNLLLFSTDPIALDSMVCRLIGIDPGKVSTLYYGMKYGLGTYKEDEITVLGNDWHDFICNDFQKATASHSYVSIAKRIPFLRNQLLERPVIQSDKCVRCGICSEVCPVEGKALLQQKKERPPVYDYSKCIRCFCCQELCPEGAITVKKPMIGIHRKEKAPF